MGAAHFHRMRSVRQYTGVAEAGSFADWYEWARGIGPYNKQSGIFVTEAGVLLVNPRNPRMASEWRCLPDTIDPRGPKAK
jgi:hypothetical protein